MNDQTNIPMLLHRISKGDRKAFHAFYDLFSQRIYTITRLYIKNPDQCEELVSDIFLSIWQNKDQLIEIRNLESYLFILSRNKALNFLDKVSRVPKFISTEGMQDIVVDETPEEKLISMELEEVLKTSIRNLPERCRIIFVMARIEKLKYQEIARILNISESTVHGQMVNAIKRLHQSVKNILGIFLFLNY